MNAVKGVFAMSKEESQTATSIDDNADSDTKQPAEAEIPSDQPSLSSAAVAFILLGLSLPVFLIALDTSIVATVGIPMNGESDTRAMLTALCFIFRLFHISQIDSNPQRTLGGMGAHIFLRCTSSQPHTIISCISANIGPTKMFTTAAEW